MPLTINISRNDRVISKDMFGKKEFVSSLCNGVLLEQSALDFYNSFLQDDVPIQSCLPSVDYNETLLCLLVEFEPGNRIS